jgi:hypothetical protein
MPRAVAVVGRIYVGQPLDDRWFLFAGLVAILIIFSVLAVSTRPGKTALGCSLACLGAGTVWLLAFVAVLTDFRDADGFSDCTPCNAVQRVVPAILVFGGALVAVTGVGSLLAVARTLVRRFVQGPSQGAT